jgi:hypothetical protein
MLHSTNGFSHPGAEYKLFAGNADCTAFARIAWAETASRSYYSDATRFVKS